MTLLASFKTQTLPARVRVEVGDAAKAKADAVVVPGFEGKRKRDVQFDKSRAQVVLKHLEPGSEFFGRPKDAVVIRTLGKLPAKRLLALGLGKRRDANTGRLRDFAARAALRLSAKEIRSIAVDVPSGLSISIDSALEAMVEGVELALFKVVDFKKANPEHRASSPLFTFFVADRASRPAARRGAERGKLIARYTNAARLMAALPSNAKPPAKLAQHLQEIAESGGLKVQVFDEKELAKRGMNALLAVGQGSTKPPRMLVATYSGGKKGEAPIALVGKGITFDTGGISLKPTFGAYPMWHMKWDMTGAAAVVSAAACAGAMKLPINLVAIACIAENMPSGSAYKPSDVVRASNGVTIEVVNADAEGRVVLADGLSHAQSFAPQAIVDVATLTGAILVALGPRTSGLFSNSDDLAKRFFVAAERTQDSLWRMPLFDFYDEIIESPIADWKNSGGTPAGSGTAAKFLEKFAGDFPWAHLDIASTAWTDRGRGEIKDPWQPKGTTASGVRLLVETVRTWKGAPKKSPAGSRSDTGHDDGAD
jgi:leucyl aminopeptidase